MKLGLIFSSFFYFVFLILMQNQGCSGCFEKERVGLLDIKHYILSQQDNGDYSDDFGSWVDDRGSNCCSWDSVKCSNISLGHITRLYLEGFLDQTLESKMLNVSLFHPFEELLFLDLSSNNFQGLIGNGGTASLFCENFPRWSSSDPTATHNGGLINFPATAYSGTRHSFGFDRPSFRLTTTYNKIIY